MRPRARTRTPTAIAEYKVGDVAAAIGGAAKTLEAAYWSEYCYHAQMEPMNAVAKVSEDGQSAEIWTGTQFGALAAAIISGMLKTTPDKIKVHQQMLGGGYGRRIWPDAAVQAAVLVQHHQEAGEADPDPRGRHRRGASAADDVSRA